MMQATADCIYSSTAVVFMLTVPCGPLMNKYAYVAVVFSSAWVALLAFHLAAQASGYWVEVERWGTAYQAFAVATTGTMGVITFSQQGWRPNVCFTDFDDGERLNDQLSFVLVFGTVTWCAGCVLYTWGYLKVSVYSLRFITIYFLCWAPQISWLLCQYLGTTTEVLHSPVWLAVIVVGLAMLGILNVLAYGTMPPEYVLYRLMYDLRTRSREEGGCLSFLGGACCRWWCWRRPVAKDSGDDSDSLQIRLLSAACDETDDPIGFDAAADAFLAEMIRQHAIDDTGPVVPPSALSFDTELGMGAYGMVYSGTYNSIDIAIKEMHCGLQPDFSVDKARYVSDLFAEAGMLARARHRNVVSFIGISLGFHGRLMLVMELCVGTLSTYLADEVPSLGAVDTFALRLRVSAELCHGLAFLHDELLVVHRDIKLDNLFVTAAGLVKVGDMGTACFVSRLAQARVAGTPIYLAPEATHKNDWWSAGFQDRIDVYAAAVTICEIFSGRAPYDTSSYIQDNDLYNAVAEGLRPSTAGLPYQIAALCRAAWHFYPPRRPRATEMITRLKAVVPVALSSMLVVDGSVDAVGYGVESIDSTSM
eukprot:CAMPEP_0182953430 /NCGR_PEP_ID=MMETSP0105_2-20130417/62269_1 /TAXON_ID=81532 ORGANISM="Acanthoeca-like sp., Strain 10tr" /NCGR_SAMPLE_ID=MMETSP0105_2 /ASSEMBLY_ACC=CAM_ASM_000205 /LENGTH=590 /DNA_ID=CAMNT_0025093751 /DNA_START=568 /DNA_END=2340 /DNA_ORIENTATION=+